MREGVRRGQFDFFDLKGIHWSVRAELRLKGWLGWSQMGGRHSLVGGEERRRLGGGMFHLLPLEAQGGVKHTLKRYITSF
jgi:hypothetical protein